MAGAGLLQKQEGGRSAFAGVKKALRLLVDDVNDTAPTDIAYTFSGYAPLGIRLVEVSATKVEEICIHVVQIPMFQYLTNPMLE